MEYLVASAIGALTAASVYLFLQARSFTVVVGLTFLSYATNLFLFAMGRLEIDKPPIYEPGVSAYADPLPQALVLTAIVISFGMTAVVVMMALGAFLEGGDDHADMPKGDRREVAPGGEKPSARPADRPEAAR